MSQIINTKEYNHIFAFKKKHLIVYTATSNSNYYRFVFNLFYINICMSKYVKAMQDDRTRTSPNSSCVLHHNVDTILSEYHHHYSRDSGNLCVHLAKYAPSKAHVFIQLNNCTKKKKHHWSSSQLHELMTWMYVRVHRDRSPAPQSKGESRKEGAPWYILQSSVLTHPWWIQLPTILGPK